MSDDTTRGSGVLVTDVARTTDGIELPLAKVTQQFLVKHDGVGNVGDCLRAAVASIFGLDVAAVPHFATYGYGIEDREDVTRHGWYYALVGYVQVLDPPYDATEGKPENAPVPSESPDDLFGCYLLTGKSPRGDWNHVVVARGGQIIWDPHPSRDGLDGEPTETCVFRRRAIDTEASDG